MNRLALNLDLDLQVDISRLKNHVTSSPVLYTFLFFPVHDVHSRYYNIGSE